MNIRGLKSWWNVCGVFVFCLALQASFAQEITAPDVFPKSFCETPDLSGASNIPFFIQEFKKQLPSPELLAGGLPWPGTSIWLNNKRCLGIIINIEKNQTNYSLRLSIYSLKNGSKLANGRLNLSTINSIKTGHYGYNIPIQFTEDPMKGLRLYANMYRSNKRKKDGETEEVLAFSIQELQNSGKTRTVEHFISQKLLLKE